MKVHYTCYWQNDKLILLGWLNLRHTLNFVSRGPTQLSSLELQGKWTKLIPVPLTQLADHQTTRFPPPFLTITLTNTINRIKMYTELCFEKDKCSNGSGYPTS